MSGFDPFAGSAPRWFAIPAHRPFLEDLAAGVLSWLGELSPETLSDATILLPNRRAARAFTAALARQANGRAVLLPQVRPLGDLEEDEPPFTPGALGVDLPPAIAPMRRRFEMARMIAEDFDRALTPLRALELADALGGFIDSCNLEEVPDPGRVARLVDGEMAEHWERSAEFLGLAIEAWPKRLEALGLVDPSWRRATLLRRLAEAWSQSPPTQPVIAAGSTGTVPAAADVLGAVARAPLGCVVLPGLDCELDARVWDLIDENSEGHPQRALKRLLERHDLTRADVRPWFQPPVEPAARSRGLARQRLLNEALRPADATDDWRREIGRIRSRAAEAGQSADPIALGLEGLSVLTLRTEEEAAAAIALLMRETLETPNADGSPRSCALVTPDQALGRRVEARLERWGVIPDSSAGRPLSRMPAGVLIDLCARFMADPLDPHVLLGLIKHPLVRLDLEETDTRRAAEALEQYGLRGPRSRDFARLQRRLLEAAEPDRRGEAPPEWMQAHLTGARSLVDRLERLAAEAQSPFNTEASLDEAAKALTRLAEALAGQNLWAGPDGECAATTLSGLIEGGAPLGALSRADFAELVRSLLQDAVVRTGGATHPSLRILGAIEARLVRADRMILAGLEEGVWPQSPATDPFLSRPMRRSLGLPPPERRLGQTAQDFVQAACAPEAILVHSDRRGGQPAVRSRWLWRLEMLTRGADSATTPVKLERPFAAIGWARMLDAPPPGPPAFAPRPQPRPPVHRRPRSLYVTRVERWVRDPYSVYAQSILRLEALERPGTSAEPLARGNAVHKAIELLTLEWPNDLPDDCEAVLHDHLLHQLGAHGFEDAAMAREAPLALNCARWLTEFERRRRERGVTLLIEQKGAMTFDAPAGAFTLKAFADRIELSGTGAAVMDFKTGAAPSMKQVKTGFSPQLTLTGAILADGGFSDTNGPIEPDELTYVRVVGRKVAGEVAVRGQGLEAADLSRGALEGLKRRIARFDDETTPYVSWAAPQFMGNQGGNYDHLARVWEWAVAGGDEEGSE